jgi:hypothetical protein
VEWIGDLERAFAASIYPNRVVIAIVAVAGVISLALIARRRGWDGPARRHPGRTIIAAVIALIVVAPLGWYVASPLVLSTTIDEPPPIVVVQATSSPAATARPTPGVTTRAVPTPAPTPTASPTPPPLALAGTFTGADDFHFGRGTARLLETAPGTYVVRLEDFAVRNGPDLYVYLSPAANGYADGVVELGRLKADKGNQNYAVPAGSDVSASASVVVWCKQFSVQFAVATLLASAS